MPVMAAEIGDRGEQCRPEFERSVSRLAVVDRRVIAQGGPVEPSGNATGAQISFGRRAGNRAAGTKQAAGGFGRAARLPAAHDSDSAAMDRGTRQGEKAARLVHGFAKTAQVAVEADQIEEIAVLAGRGVGPFAGRTRAGIGAVSRT